MSPFFSLIDFFLFFFYNLKYFINLKNGRKILSVSSKHFRMEAT